MTQSPYADTAQRRADMATMALAEVGVPFVVSVNAAGGLAGTKRVEVVKAMMLATMRIHGPSARTSCTAHSKRDLWSQCEGVTVAERLMDPNVACGSAHRS